MPVTNTFEITNVILFRSGYFFKFHFIRWIIYSVNSKLYGKQISTPLRSIPIIKSQ